MYQKRYFKISRKFRIAGSANTFDGAGTDTHGEKFKRVQQHVQFSPNKGLWGFQSPILSSKPLENSKPILSKTADSNFVKIKLIAAAYYLLH